LQVGAEDATRRPPAVALLDELQAAERAGAAALGEWIAACVDPVLRAGLRVVRARDLAHAALATDRLRALGGEPGAEAPPRLASLCSLVASADLSDPSKLAILLSRVPPPTADPLGGIGAALGDDPETRALLEGMADDDRQSLRWLHAQAGAGGRAPSPGSAEAPARLVRFLDAFRAAELGSAAVFAAWAEATPHVGLRGGLRVVAAREATHAALCDERLRDLGAVPAAALSASAQAAACAQFADPARGDDDKLRTYLGRFASPDAPAAPLLAVAERCADDVETATLLTLVGEAERATVRALGAWRVALAGRRGEPLARAAS
jgi:hypothetical protein